MEGTRRGKVRNTCAAHGSASSMTSSPTEQGGGPLKKKSVYFWPTLTCLATTIVLLLLAPGATAVAHSSAEIHGETTTGKSRPVVTPELDEVSDDPLLNSTILLQCDCNETEDSHEEGNFSRSYVKDNYLYDVPVYLVALLSLLYGIISVTAVIGNVLVLWVVTVSRRMRTKTNIFIGNLALADIIIALFAIPFQFQAALLQRWNLPEFMCAFCPFVQVLSVNVSVLTLSAIAMDRYRAILYPFKAIRISKREAVYAVFSIWCVSILLALPQELDYKVIEQEERGSIKPFCSPVLLSTTFRKSYILGLVVIQYVLPLLIISVAYAKMGAKLWGSSAPGNKEEARDENALRNKKKVVKMLAVVVVLFALCWLPLQMYNFFQTLTSINEYQYINIIWFSCHWLAMSNYCYNPFIYAIFSDKFQTEFKSRLHCLRMRARDPEDAYCSEASDCETSRSRVVPMRLNRVDTRLNRGVLRISSIEAQGESELTLTVSESGNGNENCIPIVVSRSPH